MNRLTNITDKHQEKEDKGRRSFHVRLVFVGSVFGLLLAVNVVRAAFLQVFPDRELADRVKIQSMVDVTLTGPRGAILSSNLRELAVSTESASIAIRPPDITDAAAAGSLAKILRLPEKTVSKKMRSGRGFVWLKRQVTPREKAALKELALDGVECVEDRTRYYPQKELAGQIIGFCGVDQEGLEGLEYNYNKLLKGHTGEVTLVKDARSRCYNRKGERGRAGDSLVLTLDETIQFVAENALANAARKHGAESGMAVVMEPDTGAVLALAHYPAFNPNVFSRYSPDRWRNRVVTDPFEPGSTMKIFLAAAALESGFCSTRSIFFCENGEYRVGPDVIHDTHPEAWLTLGGIVKHSSNIGAAKISETIGSKNLYEYLKRFGFGESSSVGCPAETAGLLQPYNRWTPMDRCAIAFGQGVGVSAIQLATATSAIANGGVLMRPHIVQAVADDGRRVVRRFEPEVVSRVLSEKNAAAIRRMMVAAVSEEGTGENAVVEGFQVAGKTGTAQKAGGNGTYEKGRYIASFVGFAPAEDPVITVLVVLDEPEDEYYGGQVAAPVFRTIVRETLNYKNVQSKDLNKKLVLERKGTIKG